MSVGNADGIVLRHRKDGEADIVANVLLQNGEVLPLRFHGIRASRTRSTIAAEPGALVQVTYYTKNGRASAKEAVVQDRFDDLKGSYGGMLALSSVLEMCDGASRGEPSPALFDLLQNALLRLRALPAESRVGRASLIFVIYFRVRLLELLGLLGSECASCGATVAGDGEWLLPEASFLCAGCVREHRPSDSRMIPLVLGAVNRRLPEYLAWVKDPLVELVDLDQRLNMCLENYFSRKLEATAQLHGYLLADADRAASKSEPA